ncbi:MAG: phosphate signaling complex protein PhoU [Candidatus Izemoplasma sp.]|nr:phosphate signaling complex protein PhoU [Candidatus Izemoplasma sp.]
MTNTRKHFNDELEELNNRVDAMGQEVLESYKRLVIACEDNDIDLAHHIMDHDKIVNGLEESINVDAYLLIAKQCPVASDLRQIISAVKISNDLERIADYAVNIAKYLVKTKNDNDQFVKRVVNLTNLFIPMLKEIVQAFKERNVEAALKVSKSDEEIDATYKKYVKEFIRVAKAKTDEEAEEAMRVILVLKQIERAGDHVTNIAENIVYLVNAKRLELD